MKKLLFIPILSTSILYAQTITITEAIQKTLNTHPDLKGFALEISKNDQNIISARSAYLPHISFEAEYDPQRTYVLPKNGELSSLNQQNIQVGVSLQQKIFDFDKTLYLMESANIDKEIAKLSLQEAKNLLIYKVKSLYETILIQKEALKVRREDLRTKEELYRQSLAFVTQGLKTTTDSTRFLSALYGAKESVSKAQAELEKSAATLSLYMHEDIVQDTEFETTLPIKQTENITLNNNTELQIYEKNIDKFRLQTQARKAEHYGSLDLVAAYTHFENINAYNTNFIGLTLNIPLFSGFDTSAKEQIATISTSMARESKASKTLLLKEELSKLLIDQKQYVITIEAKKAQIEASNSTKNLLEARYKEGLATYIELLDITAIALTSELELLEAKYNLALIAYKINYLTGENL